MFKSAPRVLAVVLLVSIAVLMVIASSSGFTELFKKVEASTNHSDTQEHDTPAASQDDSVSIPVISSNFPKAPIQGGLFAYVQTLEADSALTLMEVHQSAGGILLVVSGAPASGDFTVKKQSVTVVNMSEDGTLRAALTLDTPNPSYYVCSQLTSDGLAVAVKDSTKCYLFTVDYALAESRSLELPSVNSARIFPLSEGFLFLAERAENSATLIQNGAIKKSAAIQSGEVFDIVELRSSLNIFLNGINGYSIVTLDKNLAGFSVISIPEKRALKLQPVTESGIQKYIVVEQASGSVYLAKYTASFRESECERVCLGIAEGAEIFQNGESLLLLLKSTTPRVYLVDLSLGVTLSSSAFYKDIRKIHDCACYPGGYLLLISNNAADGSLTLTDVRNDGSLSSKIVSLSVEKARFTKNVNGTASIVYSVKEEANVIRIAAVSL
jgi:hypothetical protein